MFLPLSGFEIETDQSVTQSQFVTCSNFRCCISTVCFHVLIPSLSPTLAASVLGHTCAVHSLGKCVWQWLASTWPVCVHLLRIRWKVLLDKSFLDAFSKLLKVTISFVIYVCLSVRPHGTTRLPLDGFSWNLIFEYFSNIQVSSKIW
jgi:hypothetical protein